MKAFKCSDYAPKQLRDYNVDIELNQNIDASPADILRAMLQSGWTWRLCRNRMDCIEMLRDDFVYMLHPERLSWNVVLNLWQEYGYYIRKAYAAEFGPHNVATESVH